MGGVYLLARSSRRDSCEIHSWLFGRRTNFPWATSRTQWTNVLPCARSPRRFLRAPFRSAWRGVPFPFAKSSKRSYRHLTAFLSFAYTRRTLRYAHNAIQSQRSLFKRGHDRGPSTRRIARDNEQRGTTNREERCGTFMMLSIQINSLLLISSIDDISSRLKTAAR